MLGPLDRPWWGEDFGELSRVAPEKIQPVTRVGRDFDADPFFFFPRTESSSN
jgi:hypothetical protein